MSAGAFPGVPEAQCRMLVTSADPAFRGQFLNGLEYSDDCVEEALSGAHALAKMGSLPFDTLILDRHLPDLDVQEVADLVRRRFPQVKVSILDAPAPPENQRPEMLAEVVPPSTPVHSD